MLLNIDNIIACHLYVVCIRILKIETIILTYIFIVQYDSIIRFVDKNFWY